MSRSHRINTRTAVVAGLVAVLAGASVFGGLGFRLFTVDHSDTLRKADAIVVLCGEHDGREDYGLALARAGYADTVLISDPYWPRTPEDALMDRVCGDPPPGIEVRCLRPAPSTTRGEAMITARLAAERGWSRIIVVSWRFHLVRARYIFRQCFGGELVLRSVPRAYDFSPPLWAFTYAYQYAGIAKAAVLRC